MDKKQTTIMSKMVEYFEQQLSIQRTSNIKYSTEEALLDAVDVCKNAIKIERQQIEEAFVAGDERGTNNIPFNAEQYFNQTYQ